MVNELSLEHLFLRKAKMSDLDLIWHNVWQDEGLNELMFWQTTKTFNEAKDRLRRTIEYQSNHYAYFVCLKSNDEPIGFAGVIEVSDKVYEDSGICIAQRYQGLGYGKEVVEGLKMLVFDRLKGDRFLYSCFRENKISANLCRSLGFTYLKSKVMVRPHDQKEFITDYYYFDRGMFDRKYIKNCRL